MPISKSIAIVLIPERPLSESTNIKTIINMKKTILKSAFLGMILTAMTLAVSCENDETFDNVEQETELAKAKEFASKIGYNPADISIGDFTFPDGNSEKRIYIEDDIALAKADFYALGDMNSIAKQYRTNNLVTGANRTIDIIGFVGGSNGLNSTQQTALQYAVDNYNRLTGVTLNFRLTFGTDYETKDMVIYRNPSDNRTGGSAGFPSSGRPNKFIQIWTGMDGQNVNVNEHVMTHEIGHSIGFRHSDYFSRQSCGENTNEGAGSTGAIRVTGTPSGWDPTSLMNGCFSLSTNGEFNANDIKALQAMY